MAQIKNHEADRLIARPDWSHAVFLIYGPDHGLAAERAAALARATGIDLDDPFNVIRIDAGAGGDPDRLINEAYTVGMFGGRRLIWMRGAGADRQISDQVERLLTDPPPDTIVIIEAGDLKKGGLRASVEKARAGMAIPCYADNERDIQNLIDQTFSRADQRLELDARQFLTSHLGGDRAASRAELEKVALYALGQPVVSLGDVQAVCGDASALGFDDVSMAVLTGDLDGLDRAMTKFESGGGAPAALFAIIQRQFQVLDRLRADMDREGKSPAAIVNGARPPIFFARRKAMERALSIWTPRAIRAALDRLREAVLQSRRARHLEPDVLRMTLLALTVQSARRR
ncbi:MAG: DNA polymerase III subunit delta [Roseitalea porphyridii]|jgi:DNA polymerase-3 subunit delta|uniref:DNA polymerase III subunit delta n=1 Tax=Roseitalea porphyridii TaxID=1852022 RepID=UPI0032EF57A5